MTRARRAIISLFLVGLLAGSAYDILRVREHWPLSDYSMYAHTARGWTLSQLRLYMVTAEGERWLQTFPPQKSWQLMVTLSSLWERDEPRARQALRDYLRRSPAAAIRMRLYRVEWDLDPWARNAATPTRRALLAEVTR